jgi:hypothetical protein
MEIAWPGGVGEAVIIHPQSEGSRMVLSTRLIRSRAQAALPYEGVVDALHRRARKRREPLERGKTRP